MAKTRTIEHKATIDTGLFEAVRTDNPSPGQQDFLDLGIPAFSVTCFGVFQVSGTFSWSGEPGSLTYTFRLALNCGSGTLSAYNTHDDVTLPLASPGTASLDLAGGTISVEMDVEEVITYDVTGTFPSTFGPSTTHGPTKTTKIFRERVVAGTNKIRVVASVGGASVGANIDVTTGSGGNQFYLGDSTHLYGISQGASAYALPLATTVEISSEVIFDGVSVPLSCDFTASNHGHSVGGSSLSVVAPAGTRLSVGTGRGHRTTASTYIAPTRDWNLYTYFRAMEDPYPSTVDMRVDRYLGDTNHLVTCPNDGSSADTHAQLQYAYGGQFSDKNELSPWTFDVTASYSAFGLISWTDTVINLTGANVDQWTDFQCGIDSAWLLAQAEEPEDGRCFVQADVSDAIGTLTHDSTYVVEDGSNAWNEVANIPTPSNRGGYVVLAVSGGTGSASRSLDPTPAQEQPGKMDWQAAQQLEIVLQADASSKPFTLEVNGKEWEGTTNSSANTDSTVTFDLRGPHDATAATDSTQSRWPIGTEGEYFGVNATPDIVIKDLEDGVTYKINSITLKRQARSKVCFGLPTRPWLPNGVGSNYLRHVFAESYKAALEIAGMYQTGSALPDYPTVEDFFDTIDVRPGWSATNTATTEQLAMYLMYIGGIHGAYYDGSAWQHSIDLDATGGLSLVLAESVDAIRWYPYMGIPGGAYQRETPMYVGKVLRGRVNAVVIDPATHTGNSGVEVTVSGGGSAAETLTTDAEGYTRSEGRKFGSGTVSVNGNNVSVSQYNRWIAWSGFSAPDDKVQEAISIDFSPAGRFARAYVVDDTIRLAFASDASWLTFEETDTTIEGTAPQVRWQRNANNSALYFTYLDSGGVLYLAYTTSEGNGSTLATTLATDATQHDLAIGENQVIYAYWLNAAGEIKGKMLNFAGDAIQPLPTETSLLAEGFETGIDGVDDVAIACAVYAGGDGQFYVVLDYYADGALMQAVSTNGREFS